MIDTLLKLSLPYDETLSFLPQGQGVYQCTLVKPASYTDYYSLWDSSYMNLVKIVINSVRIDSSPYAKKTSLADCLSDESSFYYDISAYTLYVHFLFDSLSTTSFCIWGKLTGFSYKKLHYINDVEFQPRLRNPSSFSREVDPFEVSKMAFQSSSAEIVASDGEEDDLIIEPVPGSEAQIVLFETKDGNELEFYTGIVSSDNVTLKRLKISFTDKRFYENNKIPFSKFSIVDYPNMDEDLEGELIPEGYGFIKGAPCSRMDSVSSSGSILWKFATDATSILEVRGILDGEETVLSTVLEDAVNGEFYITYSDSETYEDIVVDAIFRPQTNPADILAAMKEKYLGYAYDASNYNTIQWESEKAYLDNVYLYMNSQKKFYEWVENLQNGTNRQFVYDIGGDGRSTIHVNYPNRTDSFSIQPEEIKKTEHESNRDFTKYYSRVVVYYAENFGLDEYPSVENIDYEEQAVRNYGFEEEGKIESLLITESNANDAAEIRAEDQSTVRTLHTIPLHITKLAQPTRELYETGTVDLSIPAKEQQDPKTKIKFTPAAMDIMEFTPSATDIVKFTYNKIVPTKKGRAYFGTIRGQVISIKFDPGEMTYKLEIRERPEVA